MLNVGDVLWPLRDLPGGDALCQGACVLTVEGMETEKHRVGAKMQYPVEPRVHELVAGRFSKPSNSGKEQEGILLYVNSTGLEVGDSMDLGKVKTLRLQ
jgi:hypothetical protein